MDCKILGMVIVIVGCFVTQNKCSDDESAKAYHCETGDTCKAGDKVSVSAADGSLYCCDAGHFISFKAEQDGYSVSANYYFGGLDRDANRTVPPQTIEKRDADDDSTLTGGSEQEKTLNVTCLCNAFNLSDVIKQMQETQEEIDKNWKNTFGIIDNVFDNLFQDDDE